MSKVTASQQALINPAVCSVYADAIGCFMYAKSLTTWSMTTSVRLTRHAPLPYEDWHTLSF